MPELAKNRVCCKRLVFRKQGTAEILLGIPVTKIIVKFIYNFTAISALVDSRNFSCVYFSYFASSSMDRYIIHSVLLKKLNIVKLDVLNHYLGGAQERIKTTKINISETYFGSLRARIVNMKVL